MEFYLKVVRARVGGDDVNVSILVLMEFYLKDYHICIYTPWQNRFNPCSNGILS